MFTKNDQVEASQPDGDPSPYPHWMLREIYEQPAALGATLERYLAEGRFRPETCTAAVDWLKGIQTKAIIAASGSSRHAGMYAELVFEALSGLSVDVEYASEYGYRTDRSAAQATLMVVSQSGETADTLAALRHANAEGHPTLAITNVEGSTMDREATVAFPTRAGRERAIPATKSFTAQLLNVYLLALMRADACATMHDAELNDRLQELASLPERVNSQLRHWDAAMQHIASAFSGAKNFLFLGRGIGYPIAREGALKLKESAYLHAEGYPGGELKHGPNALVAEGTPLVMIATVDRTNSESVRRYAKTVKLMRDMRQQGAGILALATEGDTTVSGLATYTVPIAAMREEVSAICEVIPLQLFAYWMAIGNGIHVDHPRNLTKAVLTE